MNEDWATLTPAQKRQARLERWLSAEKEKFASSAARQAFVEREKRISDIIELKVPDRVPIWFNDIGFFPARYTGITFQKMLYDSQALAAAFKKTIVDFEPDVYWPPTQGTPGGVLEIYDSRMYKWPGRGVPADCATQYVEGEYMKADEYDMFINHPADFLFSRYIPRALGVLAPLKDLPSLENILRGDRIVGELLKPEFIAAFKALFAAEPLLTKHKQTLDALNLELKLLGFPVMSTIFTSSPFDQLSDTYRGMRGIMLDMYRQPDKLLEAMDKILPGMINAAIADANRTGNPRLMSVIHRGSDAFMSKKQWETFYWPGLKKNLLAMINEGITPVVFLEGDITSRLEYFLELPKGTTIGLIDSTDIFKAKEILGKTMCLAGNVPPLLLQNGTPDQVKEHAKKLIDVAGKDGGYLMAPRSSMDKTDPHLVKIWFDFVKKYGVYK
jgi:hypothetical protein